MGEGATNPHDVDSEVRRLQSILFDSTIRNFYERSSSSSDTGVEGDGGDNSEGKVVEPQGKEAYNSVAPEDCNLVYWWCVL